jgi:hypothetical protein
MSARAVRYECRRQRVCLACEERRPRFRYRGEVRADSTHTLCFRCFRSLKDSTRTEGAVYFPLRVVSRPRTAA